jgi:hypothetical protein
MSAIRKDSERAERRKRPAFVVLFSLLPMLIGLGVLAPGMVQVMAVEGESLDDGHVRVTRRLSRYSHQPLLLPRDFSQGFVPELLDLEHLFSRVEYAGDPTARERVLLPNFESKLGNVIVLDDVDQRLREIIFLDPVLDNQVATSKYPPPSAALTPLGDSLTRTPGPQYDDYLGPQIDVGEDYVVPEPSTGVLLGLGLTLLVATRRGSKNGSASA